MFVGLFRGEFAFAALPGTLEYGEVESKESERGGGRMFVSRGAGVFKDEDDHAPGTCCPRLDEGRGAPISTFNQSGADHWEAGPRPLASEAWTAAGRGRARGGFDGEATFCRGNGVTTLLERIMFMAADEGGD